MRAALIGAFLLPAAPLAADEIALGLPIDCTLGETCYIQNHVDRAPGPEIRDYDCGGLSYDGHKGTDFGLPTLADMHRGVDVLAVAPGSVRGWRDGVADIGPTEETKGKECGNGVVLRHGNGWETQVCHLKSGSVLVRKGQFVERGDVLGQVGLSGLTEFPHVHLGVRLDGEAIDPFDTGAFPGCGENGPDLWLDAPDYTPGGILSVGFAPGIPDYAAVKDGSAGQPTLPSDAAGLVLFGYAFGGQKGDMIKMQITGPNGEFLSHSETLEKDQAQFFRASGKRLRAAQWPAGKYHGTVTLVRKNRQLDRKSITMTIR